MSAASHDLPPDLLAELNSLAAPKPNSKYVELVAPDLVLSLPKEFCAFLSRSTVSLRIALADAPPVLVYEDPEVSSSRLGDLVEHDSRLRSGIVDDLDSLDSFVSTRIAPTSALPSLLRATNRLRVAFVPLEGDLALAGKTVCSILLADLLEVSSFA